MCRRPTLWPVLLGLALVTAPPGAEAEQAVLPPVSLVLTLEVHDENAWPGMQQEILSTSQESQKALHVTIQVRAGDRRTLVIPTPKFTAAINRAAGKNVRVLVKGKLSGAYAQQMLVPFMQAFSESSAEADANTVTVEYGLTALKADLLELKLEDR